MNQMQNGSNSLIKTILSTSISLMLILFGIYLLAAAPPVAAASCVVSSTADVGGNSLRGLVELGLAGGCDNNTVTFDSSMANQTITVASPIFIEADGAAELSIVSDVPVIVSGGTITQVFAIGFDETVTMEGFTVADGSFDGIFTRPSSDGALNNFRGGAIEMQDQVTLTLRSMVFDNNEAFVGGAIFIRETSTLDVTDTTFSNNRSRSNGGAIGSFRGEINVSNSTFVDNDSNASGGAIQHFSNSGQTLTVENSTFHRNAGKQGIIFVDESTADISHITMVSNTVRVGALYADFGGTINVQNSIVYDVALDPDSGNLAEGGACVASTTNGGTFNATNNIVPNDSTACQATAFSTADPLLGPLADNGGETHTMLPDASSIAINNADIAFCTATDQRGRTRPQPTAGSCDIGAIEFTIDPPIVNFSAATYSGGEGDGSVTVGLTMNKAVAFDVSTTITVANRDSLSVDAATEETFNVTFVAGETAQSIEVTIPDDSVYEGSRAVDMTITSATNGDVGSSNTAVLTVADNDAAPTISIQDARVDEVAGALTAEFVVSLDQAAAVDITADFTVTGDTATVGDDITTINGTVTIPAGSTSATIDIVIVDDTEAESTETFRVTLSNIVNADTGGSTPEATGTIPANDGGADELFTYMPFVYSQP